ncbi:MAG: hypothetical protein A3D21_02985 [Nitrospirae bacterium RIFCSPHIGHO2_02_FULL_42_12]|nr:MAG: hypothetical protein A3D21_02985 [Nitrospirae bacterium RIFCSPHIGHO2_02_FULL_42_12]
MNSIVRKLRKGDLRQKGKSEEVVTDVLKKPQLFRHVVAGILDTEPGVRMRASDAVEKITRLRPGLLHPYKKDFLDVFAMIDQKEVRWHLAQILPRLELTKKERQQVFDILVSFLDDDSRIVKTFAMQGLADIAEVDHSYLPHVVKIVERLMTSGIPAIQSRGKKLLPQLTEARPNPALNRTRRLARRYVYM